LATIKQQSIVSFCLSNSPSFDIDIIVFSLAMSDELAQDEDAEDYDMANLEQGGGRPRGPAHPDDDDDDEDAATLVGGRAGHGSRVRDDQVVFEIGDEDGDEEDDERKQRMRRLSGEHHEREGLIGGDGRKDD
jgi:hypothetical protein